MIKADPVVRQRLETCFFFHPNPSIRRVVTIGTPHRGSRYSNDLTQWLSAKLISVPQMLGQSQDALFRENRDLLRPDSVLKVLNSIDSLSPASPFFSAMLASYRGRGRVITISWDGARKAVRFAVPGPTGSSVRAPWTTPRASTIVGRSTTTTLTWAVLEVRRILLSTWPSLRVPAEDLMAPGRSLRKFTAKQPVNGRSAVRLPAVETVRNWAAARIAPGHASASCSDNVRLMS